MNDMLPIKAGAYIFEAKHRIMEGDCQYDHGPNFVALPDFYMDKYPVTNERFARFLAESRYRPADTANFLKHWPKGYDLPLDNLLMTLKDILNKPVVWVSYDDAAAFADFYNCRLPSEEEWQYAAGGEEKLKWPWGNELNNGLCNESGGLLSDVDTYPRGASVFGIMDMCGNAREWTSALIDDEMHKFALLKGGCCYSAPHFWHPEGGAQPNYTHHKMPLLTEALNRDGMIGFRCVKEAEDAALYSGSYAGGGLPILSVLYEDTVKIRLNEYIGELLQLSVDGYKVKVSDIGKKRECRDSSETLISYDLCIKGSDFTIDGTLNISSTGAATKLSVKMTAQWPEGCPKYVELHSPFIARFSEALPACGAVRLPACPAPDLDGKSIVEPHDCFALPLVAAEPDGRGYAVFFDQYDRAIWRWDQGCNHYFNNIASNTELINHSFPIRLGEVSTEIFSFTLYELEDGWNQAFKIFRKNEQERLDLRQYNLPERHWYNKTFLHCFAYAYSRESFDYGTLSFNVEGLLKAGEEFGGYDAVMLWHQYPRLGIDQRSQWDFFDEYPVLEIKKIADKLHENGVKLMLPYKPWDIKPGDDGNQKVAELVKESGLDCIFFDTMSNIPTGMREAVDEVKTDVVFCTEGKPGDRRAIQDTTGSWEQYFEYPAMPRCGLLRYLLPKHNSHLINRWALQNRKDDMIKRAVFNGMGLVIWQDIFGTFLPFSSDQKADICKWKSIYSRFIDVFQCQDPIPVCDVLGQSLCMNFFPSDECAILTFYNGSKESFAGEMASLPKGFEGARLSELWSNRPVKNTDGSISGMIHPDEVLVVLASV